MFKLTTWQYLQTKWLEAGAWEGRMWEVELCGYWCYCPGDQAAIKVCISVVTVLNGLIAQTWDKYENYFQNMKIAEKIINKNKLFFTAAPQLHGNQEKQKLKL